MFKKKILIFVFILNSLFCLNAFSQGRYSPEAIKESFTHKNPNIKYRPGVLSIGKSRDSVFRAFGPPNGSDFIHGKVQDVYVFYTESGVKYVNPSPRARNVALAIVTMGTSVVVRQARLAAQRTQLTIYNVYYNRYNQIVNVNVTVAKPLKNPAKPQ